MSDVLILNEIVNKLDSKTYDGIYVYTKTHLNESPHIEINTENYDLFFYANVGGIFEIQINNVGEQVVELSYKKKIPLRIQH